LLLPLQLITDDCENLCLKQATDFTAGVTAPQSETPENFDLALGEFSVCSTTHFPDFGACRMQRNLNGQSPILERMVFYLNDCSKI
jgi:hypothetical protein